MENFIFCVVYILDVWQSSEYAYYNPYYNDRMEDQHALDVTTARLDKQDLFLYLYFYKSYDNQSWQDGRVACTGVSNTSITGSRGKYFQASIYLLKVNKRNIRRRCEIYSKLTIKTPERRHCHRPGVFIVNFEHISHLVLVFLLLTLNM